MQRQPLSASAKAFAAIKAAWGVQRFGAMFAGLTDDEYAATIGLWDSALSGFPPGTIESVISDFIRRGDQFPPHLPPLVAACNARATAARTAAVQLPMPNLSTRQIERNLQRVHAALGSVGHRPPMFWAMAPKSAVAVRVLIDAAQRDSRLLDILRQHEHTNAAECRSDEAAKALRAFFDQSPDWYRHTATA